MLKEKKKLRTTNEKIIKVKKQKSKGITLIALVITIIVLLILAGVTIAALAGPNGIITNSVNAKIEYGHSKVTEAIILEWSNYQIEINTSDTDKENAKIASTEKIIIPANIKNNLANGTGETFIDYLKNKGYINEEGIVNVSNLLNETLSTGNGTGTTDVYKIESEIGKYTLKYYETAEKVRELWQGGGLDWNKILEEAEKNPEKIKEESGQLTSDLIGIGTDGKPVNMDLWRFKYDQSSDSYIEGESDPMYRKFRAYRGDIIDGKIEGTIPQYIYNEEQKKFKKVTSLIGMFCNLPDLVVAPTIPSTVTEIRALFADCKNLIQAPTIPNSVTSMYETFDGCSNLKQAPEIPSSVTSMSYTFRKCTNLTGTLIINANAEDKIFCLEKAATADNCNLILSGSSPQLQEIYDTRSENSHITCPQLDNNK